MDRRLAITGFMKVAQRLDNGEIIVVEEGYLFYSIRAKAFRPLKTTTQPILYINIIYTQIPTNKDTQKENRKHKMDKYLNLKGEAHSLYVPNYLNSIM